MEILKRSLLNKDFRYKKFHIIFYYFILFFNQLSKSSFLLLLYLFLVLIDFEFFSISSRCFLESGVAYISVDEIVLCPKKSLIYKSGVPLL